MKYKVLFSLSILVIFLNVVFIFYQVANKTPINEQNNSRYDLNNTFENNSNVLGINKTRSQNAITKDKPTIVLSLSKNNDSTLPSQTVNTQKSQDSINKYILSDSIKIEKQVGNEFMRIKIPSIKAYKKYYINLNYLNVNPTALVAKLTESLSEQPSIKVALSNNLDDTPDIIFLSFQNDETDANESVATSNLVQFDNISQHPKYLFIQSSMNINDLQIDLINGETEKAQTNSWRNLAGKFFETHNDYNTDRTSGLKYSTLNIIPRVVWGGNAKTWDQHSPVFINSPQRFHIDKKHNCSWIPEYYRVDRIIVHHTVTKNYPNDPYRAVREIYLYHVYSLGWGDVGYNFLIDSEGRIFEGKIGGEGAKGYHAYTAAFQSVAISLIGDFTYHNPTPQQLESLKLLMAEKAALHGFELHYGGKASLSKWRNSYYTVFGHRDSYKWNYSTHTWTRNITGCPGNSFYDSGLLENTIAQAEQYRQTHFQEIKNARNYALDMVSNISYSHIPALKITFNLPPTTPYSTVEKYVPQFLGAVSTRIHKNTAYFSIQSNNDNGYCGYVVPPYGWKGYDVCGSQGCMFFPPSKGAIDRLTTAITVFKLDPSVQKIEFTQEGILH